MTTSAFHSADNVGDPGGEVGQVRSGMSDRSFVTIESSNVSRPGRRLSSSATPQARSQIGWYSVFSDAIVRTCGITR